MNVDHQELEAEGISVSPHDRLIGRAQPGQSLFLVLWESCSCLLYGQLVLQLPKISVDGLTVGACGECLATGALDSTHTGAPSCGVTLGQVLARARALAAE